MPHPSPRNTPFLLVILILLLLAMAVARRAPESVPIPVPPPAPAPVGGLTLTLLHINDHHSHLEPDDGVSLTLAGAPTQVEMGGFPRVVAKFRELATQAVKKNPVLKIHAGDAITGSLYYSTFKGEADAALMNQVCFDLFIPGNHEFDNGDGQLRTFLDHLAAGGCGTRVLAANVVPQVGTPLAPDSPWDYLQPFVIKRFGDERVGIIGIDVAGKTRGSSSPLPTTQFLDEARTAQHHIDQLEAAGIHRIILITHHGHAADQALAARLRGVDVIIGGDSHSLLGDFAALGLNPEGPYPTQVQDREGQPVCIAQAWQYALAVGELRVRFDAEGRVSDCAGTAHLLVGDRFKRTPPGAKDPVELTGAARQAVLASLAEHPGLAPVSPDPGALKVLSKFSGRLDQLKRQVVGRVTETLCLERIPGQGLSSLCPRATTVPHGGDLPQLVARAYLARGFAAQIALQNSGGVRTDLPPGDLRIADVYAVLPFANGMVLVDMSGAEIRDTLEDALDYALIPGGSSGAYPYAAGLRWSVDLSRPKGERFSNLEVKPKGAPDWTPLDPARRFKVVVNDFIARGQDGWTTLGRVTQDKRRVEALHLDYAQGFIDYVQQDLQGVLSKPPVSEYSTQRFLGLGGRP